MENISIHKAEYGIKNYLNKHKIYKGNDTMQAIIINSFVIERGVSNDETSFKTTLVYLLNTLKIIGNKI